MILFYHMPKTAGTFLRVRFEATLNCLSLYPIQCQCWMSHYQDRPVELKCSHHYPLLKARRKPDDYFFTFIRHPVDIIYSRYAYLTGYSRGNRYNIMSADQQKYYDMSFDEHIDQMKSGDLYTGVYDKKGWDIDFNDFNFVGIVEDMDDSLKILNQDLGTSIINNAIVNKGPEVDKSYRRDELEEICADQIEIFEDFRRKIKNKLAE